MLEVGEIIGVVAWVIASCVDTERPYNSQDVKVEDAAVRRRIVVIAVGVEGGDGCAGGGGGGGLGHSANTEEVRPVKKKFRPDIVQQPTEKETSTVAVFENSKATLIA